MSRNHRCLTVGTLVTAIFLATTSFGATTTTTADGGSIQTKLIANIVLNKESTLRREWVAVHDDTMPVDLVGTPGVATIYQSGESRYSRGNYRYKANYTVRISEPVVAIEVRFITFDVWGDRTRALTATDIKDFAPGDYSLDAEWNLYSENEASDHYASIGYVAAIRTKTGEIHQVDVDAITGAARQYMSDFTSDLLDEDPPE